MRGSRFKHFQILEPIGRGGMGEVFLALDSTLERRVALKFLPRSLTGDPAAQGRLLDEARSCSRIQHPNVAVVHSIEEDGGIFAICMEYVEGKTLKALLETHQLSIGQVLSIATGIADGLHAAHELKVIHRDLKPANVIVTARGEVKVMDFGLALRPARTVQTAGPESFGTVTYMSPEQARGRELDRATDIFSLGSTLYEVLAGHPPFEGENDLAVLQAIIGHEPPPLREIRRDVPPALDRTVRCCMEKDKERRYATMAAVAEDLRKLQWIVESGPKDLIGELASGLRDRESRAVRSRDRRTRLSENLARKPPAPGSFASVVDLPEPGDAHAGRTPSQTVLAQNVVGLPALEPTPRPSGSAPGGERPPLRDDARHASASAHIPANEPSRGAASESRASPESQPPPAQVAPTPPPMVRTLPSSGALPRAGAARPRPRVRRAHARRSKSRTLLGLAVAVVLAGLGIFLLGHLATRHASPAAPTHATRAPNAENQPPADAAGQ